MRHRLVPLLVPLLVALSLALASAPASAREDRRARAVLDRLYLALGGPDVPYRTRSIGFTFAVEKDGAIVSSRRHEWEPATGNHKLLGEEPDGTGFLVDWNLHARAGSASRGGRPAAGAELAELLDRAHKAWVNDTYWLLMPYKLRDPGVHVAWDGEERADGKLYDRLRVTFDRVGLTPGDTYWAYVARDTGLMERWSFVLQGQEPPPVAWRWLRWKAHGPLLLSERKEAVAGGRAILTSEIAVK